MPAAAHLHSPGPTALTGVRCRSTVHHCPPQRVPAQPVSARPAPAQLGLTGPGSGRTSRPPASSFNSTLFD